METGVTPLTIPAECSPRLRACPSQMTHTMRQCVLLRKTPPDRTEQRESTISTGAHIQCTVRFHMPAQPVSRELSELCAPGYS